MGVIQHVDVRKGVKLLIDGNAWEVIDAQHVKPGKGSAFVRAKVRNLATGQVVEKTYKSGDKVTTADTRDRRMQYLYREGDNLVFMDTRSYEQVHVPAAVLGEKVKFLPENAEVEITFHDDKPLGIELPNFIEVEITDTEPGFKGDTVSGGGKPATISTGAVVSVPFHLEPGDRIMVDTRTGTYVKKL